jgi:hypothetical protein
LGGFTLIRMIGETIRAFVRVSKSRFSRRPVRSVISTPLNPGLRDDASIKRTLFFETSIFGPLKGGFRGKTVICQEFGKTMYVSSEVFDLKPTSGLYSGS